MKKRSIIIVSGDSTPSEQQSNPQERAAISQSTTPNPAEQSDTGTTLEVTNSSSKAQIRIQTNTTEALQLVQHQDSQPPPPPEQLRVQANRVSPVSADNPSDDSKSPQAQPQDEGQEEDNSVDGEIKCITCICTRHTHSPTCTCCMCI